jgi:hypothetical protein
MDLHVVVDRRIVVEYTCPTSVANQPPTKQGLMEPANPYASPQGGTLIEGRRPIPIPTTIADTLRVATSLYIGNVLPIAGITLLFWVPLEFARAYLDFFVLDPENPASSFHFSVLIEHVIGIIPATGITAIGAAALKGEEPTLRLGIVQGFEAWPRVFVARLTVSVAILLAAVLFVIPGLYIAVRAAFAEQAALIENRGGMGAPGRSFELTRGNFWRTTGVLFFAYGYLWTVAILLEIPTQFFDHWLVSATLSVVIEMLAPWAILVLLTAYWSLAHSGQVYQELPAEG